VTRGLCGGCLFALPLIYTMEMWWIGYDIPTLRVVAYLGVALAFLFGLNALSGFREEDTFATDLGDAVVSLAIGIVVSAVMLLTLGELSPDTSRVVALRQIIVLAIPVSLGVSVSRAQLSAKDEPPDDPGPVHALSHRLGVTVAGGMLLGMSAAPTEEIRMIASRVAWPHLLGMTAVSLAVTWAVLFVAAFPRQHVRRLHQNRGGEVMLVHAIGLSLSALMLGAFGFLGGEGSVPEMLAIIVTLAMPTTIGAAAGRLIL
jgi:putative integral membrane protein (TIGR02587 family)